MDLTQLQEVAYEFALGKIKTYKKSNQGIVNHNWIVTTRRGTYVIRGVPSFRTIRQVQFEQRLIEALAKKKQAICFPYHFTLKMAKAR